MHGFLFFHINFKISLLVSHKIKTLIKISVNLYINYEEIDIFLCCYPTHELGILLYLYLLYILLKKCLFIIYFWVFVAACWLSLGVAYSQPSPMALMAPQSGDRTSKTIRLGTKASPGPAPCRRLQAHLASFWVCRSPVSPPPAVPGLFCPLPGVPHRYSQMAAAARDLTTTWGGLQPE